MVKTNPPGSEWLKIGVERGFTLDSGSHEHLPLKKILLGIGGWGVCIHQEPDLGKILKRGRRFPARSKTMRGEPIQCHLNSACCWDENRDLCTICTGYALSKDGMWRQHSWVFTNDKVVVETTEKRVAYWGFLLKPDECERFLFNNM